MPLAGTVGRNTASSKGSIEESLLFIDNTQKMKARIKDLPVESIPNEIMFDHKS